MTEESPKIVTRLGSNRTPRLPEIQITTEEHLVNDQAIQALREDPNLYQRGMALVQIVAQDPDEKKSGVWYPDGGNRIEPVEPATLRERLTRYARWTVYRERKQGDSSQEPAHPPSWCVYAVHARKRWRGIRHLLAFTETPTLRPDGSLIDRPGYDEQTGIAYLPSDRFADVPSLPSHEEAKAAAQRLLFIVEEYDFADPSYRATWLAALLTPFARRAVDGDVPLFLFEANSSRVGKSLLADTIGVVVTGRRLARMARPAQDEEFRKTITGIAMAGDPMVLLDNVRGKIDSPALEAAITGKTWRARSLGINELTPELPLDAVWYVTSNNAEFTTDLANRTLHVRIEVKTENPEEREFQYQGAKLLDEIRRRRPQLVADALTVLRGYIAAGRPARALPKFGGFDAWQSLVANAVDWAGVGNPFAMRPQLLATVDSDRNVRAELLQGMRELDPKGAGLTLHDVYAELREGRRPVLKDALMTLTRTKGDDLPPSHVAGRYLAKLRGVPAGGLRLEHLDPEKPKTERGIVWRVVPLTNSVVKVPDPGENAPPAHGLLQELRAMNLQVSRSKDGKLLVEGEPLVADVTLVEHITRNAGGLLAALAEGG